jgi:hypothetical protein
MQFGENRGRHVERGSLSHRHLDCLDFIIAQSTGRTPASPSTSQPMDARRVSAGTEVERSLTREAQPSSMAEALSRPVPNAGGRVILVAIRHGQGELLNEGRLEY